MPLESIDPRTCPDWDAWVLSLDGHSIFHSTGWCRALCETYRYTPHYLVERGDGVEPMLAPLIEVRSRLTGHRAVALPFTDFCPALGSPAARARAVAAAITTGQRRGWRYIEWRGDGGQDDAPAAQDYVEHTLSLDDTEDALMDRISSSTRRAIRKADREGVTTQADTSLQAVRSFYRLNRLTRREHGLPPQPFRFFEALHRHVLAPGQGDVITALLRGQAVASAVFLMFGHKALFKYGASDPKSQALRPSNAVMWEGIRWCAAQGATTLSLGRTAMGNAGLRRFKNGWGTTETIRPYSRYDIPTGTYVTHDARASTTTNRVFRHAPLILSRLAGSLLYRHAA